MSDPQRHRVRVRRAPKVGVFLLIGAVLGALVAIIAVNVTPADATVPKIQAIGFLVLLLAPLGALVLGVVALVLDRIAEHRAREVEIELIESARSVPEDGEPARPIPSANPASSGAEEERR